MKTFTEIPAVDLQQINNYLDNYEILLDRKGYALSDLKVLSQKRREETRVQNSIPTQTKISSMIYIKLI